MKISKFASTTCFKSERVPCVPGWVGSGVERYAGISRLLPLVVGGWALGVCNFLIIAWLAVVCDAGAATVYTEPTQMDLHIESGPVTLTELEPAGRMPGITSTNTFIAYYGSDYSPERLEALAQFDVVVLHTTPTNCTPAVVSYLQSNGVRYVLGYISIGEEHGYLPWMTGDGQGPVHYSEDGEVVFNEGGVYNDGADVLVLDGSLEDWIQNGYIPFGLDSHYDVPHGFVNWVEGYWAHDAEHYYLAYRAYDALPIPLTTNYQVFVDTDLDVDTGYRGPDGNFSVGADYMIQGTHVYAYTGTGGTNWGWEFQGAADHAISNATVEMRFPKEWMGNPSDDAIRVIFVAADGGGDLYPDRALEGGYFPYPLFVASYYMDQAWSSAMTSYISNGRPDINKEWGGRFVWPNDDWRDVIRRQRIGGVAGDPDLAFRSEAGLDQLVGARAHENDMARTNNFGFDGFFLDTIDTAGPFATERSYPWTAEDMSKTVRYIRESFPDHIIFANRGVFFYNPNAVDDTWGIRPFDYTIRPYVHAVLFESYTLDSSANPGVSVWFEDNKYTWAPKINVAANYPDGFTVFCLDYEMDRGAALYDRAIQEAAVSNGWVVYLSPGRFLEDVGLYALENPPAPDVQGPAWDSTAGVPGGGAPPVRVGLQDARLGPRYDTVVLHWDVARDQTPPIRYDILHATNESFIGTVTVFSNVAYEVGNGWAQSTENAYAHKYELPPEVLGPGDNYFRVRARDSSTPEGRAEANTVTLRVAAPPPITNPHCHIVVDGNIAEWADFTFFPSDPADVPDPDTIDWRELVMAHDETHYYIAFSNHYPLIAESNMWSIVLLLETDSNRDTGFRGFHDDYPVGADYAVIGYYLYRYTGSGTDWDDQWEWLGSVEWQLGGHTAECAVPRAWLDDADTIRLFAHGHNWQVGADSDYMPDDALSGGHFLYVVPDPWTIDTDGDGFPDGWEYLYFNCYTNALPHVDADGDGMSNWQEYVAGTNPTDSNSFFGIQWVDLDEWEGPEEAVLRLDTVLNYALSDRPAQRIYAVDRASCPLQADWEQIVPDFWGTGGPVYVPKTNFVSHRVYRARVRMPGEPFPE